MANAAGRTATYKDSMAASDLLVAEIVFGRLVTHRRGDIHHNRTLALLMQALAPVVWPQTWHPQSWIGLRRVEVHLGPHVVVPDVAAWRLGRVMPLLDGNWIDLAPEWACEVLSPATALRDRGEKRIVYAKAGVRHLWLVDPTQRLLEAFELHDGKWKLLEAFRDNDKVVAPPFAELSFPLNSVWSSDGWPAVQSRPMRYRKVP